MVAERVKIMATKIVYVSGLYLDASYCEGSGPCARCGQTFDTAQLISSCCRCLDIDRFDLLTTPEEIQQALCYTHPAYAWQVAPDELVRGPVCPACTEALLESDQIAIDNTLVFVGRGNGTMHFEPLAQRPEGVPPTRIEQALMAVVRSIFPDWLEAPADDRQLGVIIEPEDEGVFYECVVCGARCTPRGYTPVAYHELEELGALCPTCLAAGPAHWPSLRDELLYPAAG